MFQNVSGPKNLRQRSILSFAFLQTFDFRSSPCFVSSRARFLNLRTVDVVDVVDAKDIVDDATDMADDATDFTDDARDVLQRCKLFVDGMLL